MSSLFEQKIFAALATMQAQHPRLKPGRKALIGVSGGRDSIALLHCLVSAGWKNLIVCHLNHGLRGRESGQDAVFVRKICRKHNLACEVTRQDIQKICRVSKVSVELAARNERYKFLQAMAKKHKTRFLFLAHHADDQAETVLTNLCRGTSLKGLTGMQMMNASHLGLDKLRPMLEVSRIELDAYVQKQHLQFREDSSNAASIYVRNRLRHEVLPLLSEIFDRDVGALIARMSTLLARDERALQNLVLDFINAENVLLLDGSLRLTPRLKALESGMLARLILHWLQNSEEAHGIGSLELQQIMSMLQPGGSAKVNLPGKRWVRRKAQRLFVEHGLS